MSRCRSCNRMLDEYTLKAKNFKTGEEEDMCSNCREKAFSDYNILFDHEYGHAATTGEALLPKDGYFYEFFD